MFGDSFRNYENSERQEKVAATYGLMHQNQTVEFVPEQREKWMKFNKAEFTVMEVISMLDDLIDDSDPDVDIPNSIHDFRTAERIREQWPGEEFDWFHLVGLLHDLGKGHGTAEDGRKGDFATVGRRGRHLPGRLRARGGCGRFPGGLP